MNYFDEIFNRLKKELNYKSDKEMYQKIGVIQGTFTNWRRRNKIPYEVINSICINEKLDLNYIINGIKNEKYEKNINFKDEIYKMLSELDEKKAEIYYHLIKAEILKQKL